MSALHLLVIKCQCQVSANPYKYRAGELAHCKIRHGCLSPVPKARRKSGRISVTWIVPDQRRLRPAELKPTVSQAALANSRLHNELDLVSDQFRSRNGVHDGSCAHTSVPCLRQSCTAGRCIRCMATSSTRATVKHGSGLTTVHMHCSTFCVANCAGCGSREAMRGQHQQRFQRLSPVLTQE